MKTSLKAIAYLAALAVLVTVISCSGPAPTPAPAPTPEDKLQGVWKITEVTFSGENPQKITVSAEWPNLMIVTKKHFSFMNIAAVTPRPDLPQQGATDAQKVATWTPFVAWAGTYEVKGNIFTARSIVAKNPSEMAPGNFGTSEFKIEGDTFTNTPKTDQNGPIANPIITKFVRVE